MSHGLYLYLRQWYNMNPVSRVRGGGGQNQNRKKMNIDDSEDEDEWEEMGNKILIDLNIYYMLLASKQTVPCQPLTLSYSTSVNLS